MKSRIMWPLALMLIAFGLFAPARAEAEFCPAHVQKVAGVAREPGTYAVRLAAGSERHVTGQFFVETAGGWFRAPFPPLALSKSGEGIVSPFITVVLPADRKIMNVWLAQAASDDASWRGHGTVFCAPQPSRLVAESTIDRAQMHVATAASAQPMAAPFTYHCASPFAPARFQGDALDGVPYAPGQYAIALVDIDADGKVLDVTPMDASNGDFTLRNELKDRVMHMPVTPARAYCRNVPSTYLLREGVPAQ